MRQRDPRIREALAHQADTITGIFRDAGYSPVEPEILQPADVFLERYGEEIRGRTYVFTDPDGAELCLRPDLTIPTCRVHLYHHSGSDAGGEARYCYNGPAFRYQPGGQNGARPREFEQVGVEFFGGADREQADVEVMALARDAVRAAGLETFTVHLGDLGLFSALVDGIEMPERWRTRLKQRFWRPRAFRALLARLAGHEVDKGNDGLRDRIASLAGLNERQAIEAVDHLLGECGIPLTGGRGVDEIAMRLLEQARDADEEPLPQSVVDLIQSYLSTEGPPREALQSIADLDAGGAAMDAVLETFSRRLDLMAERGIDEADCFFSAEFGRNLEYYTGFVFQIEIAGRGVAGQIAGGGRYDTMLADLGAPQPVPAVGLAIHTERLLAAVSEGHA